MKTRTSRTLTALAAATMLVLASGPADAASADMPVTITPGSTLTVTGDGYGHGHGMSQWGARGAANANKSYQEILGFYYPGTTLAAAGGTIRVLITADTDNNLKIAQAPGLKVRDLGNGKTYKLNRTARAWRLKTVFGKTRVYYKTGTWHLYKTGGRRALAGDGQFQSSVNQLTLKLPSGSRVYRGKLRFTNTNTVNVVNIEKYLRGVVAAEMPASWPAAALQSQAVAARTYAARERADHATGYYDLCDTTACQVYGGLASEDDRTSAAIAATAGKTLTYGGQYAFAQFAASNGGWTSYGGQPYLPAQSDPYDKAYHHWTANIDPAKLQAAHPEIGTLQTVQISKREGDRLFDSGGWVQTVTLTGTGGSKTSVDISGSEFRSIYRLRSAYFTFDNVS